MPHKKQYFSFYASWIAIGLLIGIITLVLMGKFHLPGPAFNSSTHIPENKIHAGYALAVNQVADAVVSIRATRFVRLTQEQRSLRLLERFLGAPHTPETSTKSSNGSGVIMDDEGYILTNHHVIKNADRLDITLRDGRNKQAKLVGTDPETDLAVLKIELDDIKSATDADIQKQYIGDIVLAIGYPFEFGQTVTQGIISAKGRKRISSNTYENFLQTDAAINPGNSGGALINTLGEIVGINSLIYTETGTYNGIGFAIPIDMARHVLEQIKQHGYVVRGWLGVEGQDLPPEILKKIGLPDVRGILVTDVDTNGPGGKAGLQAGDIITHINKQPIYETSDVLDLVAEGQPGDIFSIDGIRKRQSFSLEATLGQRPVMSR